MLLEGERPNPASPPSGCHFHTRCRYAKPECSVTTPPLDERAPGHFVACHFAAELTLKGAFDHASAGKHRDNGDAT